MTSLTLKLLIHDIMDSRNDHVWKVGDKYLAFSYI